MSTIHQSYSMDYTAQIHYAKRADGQWFTRCQFRDPRYGYKWGAWRACSAGMAEGSTPTERKARLPK